MRRSLAFLTLLALSGCVALDARGEMTVPQVLASWEGLDGKVVRIRGWMDECSNFRCELHSAAEDIGRYDRRSQITLGRKSAEFDALLNSYRGQEIVVQGTFEDECLSGICTDRASVLEPIRVLRVIRHEGP